MREGELLGLKWADVDLEAGTLRVRHTLTRHGGKVALREPKTKKSRRTVRLTPRAAEAFRCHRACQAGEKLRTGSLYEDQGLVFAGEGGGLINPSNLRQRSFLPLLKRAGLPGSPSTTSGTPTPCSYSRGTFTPSSSRSSSGTPLS